MKGTIRSSEEISELFNSAQRYRTSSCLFIYAQENDRCSEAGRYAVIAGKRTGNAPVRNRIRRRLREAARLEGAPWEGNRVLIVAKAETRNLAFEQLRSDIRSFLRRMQAKS